MSDKKQEVVLKYLYPDDLLSSPTDCLEEGFRICKKCLRKLPYSAFTVTGRQLSWCNYCKWKRKQVKDKLKRLEEKGYKIGSLGDFADQDFQYSMKSLRANLIEFSSKISLEADVQIAGAYEPLKKALKFYRMENDILAQGYLRFKVSNKEIHWNLGETPLEYIARHLWRYKAKVLFDWDYFLKSEKKKREYYDQARDLY